MKNRKIVIILAIAFFLVTGCTKTKTEITAESLKQLELTGNLITIQAYYHNVIEYIKPKESGLLHVLDKDKKLFAEYTGTIKLGIDFTKVKFENSGSKVKITIPKGDVIGEPSIDSDDFKEENFIESEDTFLNTNTITLEDSNKAFEEAQIKMKESAQNDNELKVKAQKSAKLLIIESIKQVYNLSDKEIEDNTEWEYE